MESWRHFIWLAEQAWSVFTYFWPLTGGLFVTWLVLERRAWLRGRRPRGELRGSGLDLLPVIVPIAVLVLGALFACQDCTPSSGIRHEWAERSVDVLLIVQLVGAAWLVWRASGRRWPTAAWHLLLVCLSLAAGFVATMSISGDWL